MDKQAGIDRVIASLLDAQLDDTRWSAASALLDEACGLSGNHLAVIRGNSAEDAEFLFGKLYKRGESDEELEQLYVNDYFSIDERLPRYFSMKNGEPSHITTLFTDRELKESPTYNEYLVPTGAGDSLNVHMDASDGIHIVMALVPSGHISQWTSEQISTIKYLLPHIRQFVRVRQALADVQCSALNYAADALGAKRIGIVLLNRFGFILEANDRARTILASGHGLSDRGGRLTPRFSEDGQTLDQLINQACEPHPAALNGGSIPIRSSDGSSLVLHVSPLAHTKYTNFSDVFGCSVMVLIVDSFDTLEIDPSRVAQALDLSPAQSRVLAALASGNSVKAIARSSFRTEAAVRWHVKELISKFGFSSQSDLIRLVLTTPGVFDHS